MPAGRASCAGLPSPGSRRRAYPRRFSTSVVYCDSRSVRNARGRLDAAATTRFQRGQHHSSGGVGESPAAVRSSRHFNPKSPRPAAPGSTSAPSIRRVGEPRNRFARAAWSLSTRRSSIRSSRPDSRISASTRAETPRAGAAVEVEKLDRHRVVGPRRGAEDSRVRVWQQSLGWRGSGSLGVRVLEPVEESAAVAQPRSISSPAWEKSIGGTSWGHGAGARLAWRGLDGGELDRVRDRGVVGHAAVHQPASADLDRREHAGIAALAITASTAGPRRAAPPYGRRDDHEDDRHARGEPAQTEQGHRPRSAEAA
jgi:hypothetical protein